MLKRFLPSLLALAVAVTGVLVRPVGADAAGAGAILVPGPAWAGSFASLGDLNVYSNGGDLSNSTPGPYGGQYQCTELAHRWISIRYGEPRNAGLGSAASWWTDGPSAPVPLIQHPNGGADGPRFGDILVFGATSYDTTGHVAVVTGATATTVGIVEQNWSSTAGAATLPISGTTMPARWGLPVLGWLRPTAPAYAPASTSTTSTTGGYSVDGYGGIQPYGGAPRVSGSAYWPGWDIARGIVRQPGKDSGYVLDGFGGLHPFGGAPQVRTSAYWPGWDIARAVALRADGVSGYVLDGYGGLHPFGGAPAVATSAYWPGWTIARSVALRPDGVSGYVLDGYGGVHPFGGAPAATLTAYWPNWDIARGIALIPGTSTGYVLDAWGAIHPINGAPARQTAMTFPDSNLADGLVVSSAGGDVGYRNGAVSPLGYGHVGSAYPGLPIVRGIS